MLFETPEETLAWFEGQERVLTPAFISGIPWGDVRKHEIRPEFIPILLYMRDVEKFTDLYYAELMRTPTGKNPVNKAFMDRWSAEEPVHAELLNRFLNEAGFSTSERWFEQAKRSIPVSYRVTGYLQPYLTNLIGRQFSAVHMTWGAIQEHSTLSGYERLWRAAGHPVLEYILRAIAREEARHALFYWSLARIELNKSANRQRLARFLVEKFWTPVGQGAKRAEDTNLVIGSLFRGAEGMDLFRKRVNDRIAQLPGFEGFTRAADHVAEVTGHAPALSRA